MRHLGKWCCCCLILFVGMFVFGCGPIGCGENNRLTPGEQVTASKAAHEKAHRLLIKKKPSVKKRPNVVMIVMDTLRSDHMSLCGYTRPTTPVFEKLAKQSGVVHSCNVIAPGSWTLPSHGSFFTGVDPLKHEAHSIYSDSVNLDSWGSNNAKLTKRIPTLAEKMNHLGYETVAISANPVVSDSLGVLRGFKVKEVASKWGMYFGDRLLPKVKKALSTVDKEKPVFVFINIADAHQPWTGIPEGVNWLPKRARQSYSKKNPKGNWRQYIAGTLPEKQKNDFIEQLVDVYDFAVSKADKNLGVILEYLKKQQWCGKDCRVVVVSDHGELLGEHGLLDHGHYVYDGLIRVPMMTFNIESTFRENQLISGTQAFYLALNGGLEKPQKAIYSMAWPHVRRCGHLKNKAFCSTSVALWDGSDKLLYRDGDYFLTDLKKDPGENRYKSLIAHPSFDTLKDLAKKVVKEGYRGKKDAPADVFERLKALGYMD